jgi:aryl-alcohol dehydrogenase-like predicted oxidoreductase
VDYSLLVETLPRSLVIGSANFGSQYGAKKSWISAEEVNKIIQDATGRQNVFIETSESYLGAEAVIGEALKFRIYKNIILKVSPSAYSSEISFMQSVESSLLKTGQSSVYAIMLHGVGDSLGNSKTGIRAGIKNLLKSGMAEKVGLSCYSVSEVLASKTAFPEMSIFQLPENIIDQRKKYSKELSDLSESGVVFQVRSIFLQGLLIGNNDTAICQVSEFEKLRTEVETLAAAHNIDTTELCLRYALSIRWASQFVMGFENFDQYSRNLQVFESKGNDISFDVSKGSDFIIDPRNWS